MFYFGNIQSVRASFYINRAMNVSLEESIRLFQKSFKIHSMSRLDGSKYFYNKIGQSFSGSPYINRETIKNELQVAEKELEKNIKENPLDFYLHLQLAGIYNDYFQLTGDREKLILAESVLREAIVLSPKNQRGYWRLADVMFFQGKYEEQIELLQRAIDLEPRLAESHWYLATAYTMAGQKELSRKKLEDIIKNMTETKGKKVSLREMANFYINWADYYSVGYIYQESIKNNPKKALLDVQKIFKNNPQDLNTRGKLFMIYIQLGEIDKAEELIKDSLGSMPESRRNDFEKILQNAKKQQ